MVERGKGGKVINVASIGGLIAWPNIAAYCASKAGCAHLTKVMATEWVRYNIQVNAILPGYFATPLNAEFFSSDVGKKVINNIPMRRLGQVEEMKGLAILLASQASNFMKDLPSLSMVAIPAGSLILCKLVKGERHEAR
jgi:2-deoxy-D-gluconate 3-dehydrogenase